MFIGRCFVHVIARLRAICRIADQDMALLKECLNFWSFTAITLGPYGTEQGFDEVYRA
jgi:hypothetical protein